MNLNDLASHLKLSTGTVSVCLSGDPKKLRISEATVERVRRYAGEVGYVPNGLAQKIFHRGDSGVIGLLLKQEVAINRNLPILAEAVRRLSQKGREYTILSSPEKQIPQTLRTFKSLKIHQIIVIGMILDQYLGEPQFLKGLNLYAPDYYFGKNDFSAHFRYRAGINRPRLHMALGRLLHAHGLAPIMCDANSNPEILIEEGLLHQEDVLPAAPQDSNNLFSFGESLAPLILSRRPRSVIVHSDQVAVGLCHELLKQSVRIPEEISVIGFNHSQFSEYAEIPLTTIDLPTQDNVNAVLDHLLDNAPLPEAQEQNPHFFCGSTTPDDFNIYLKQYNRSHNL